MLDVKQRGHEESYGFMVSYVFASRRSYNDLSYSFLLIVLIDVTQLIPSVRPVISPAI